MRYAVVVMLAICSPFAWAGDGQEIVRTVDPRYGVEVGVERPDGRFVTVRELRIACEGTSVEGTTLHLDPALAMGLDWQDTPRRPRWAFDTPGHYVVWVSHNLETEQDNTTHLEIPVEWKGAPATRPATPSPELCDVALD
jgi:hypothetical protein